VDEIGTWELDPLPAAGTEQNRQQNDQGKRGARLREDQGLDGTDGGSSQRQSPRENGPPERGTDTPQECGGGDEEISAKGVRPGICGILD